jgi:SpoIID/LytB domain protein
MRLTGVLIALVATLALAGQATAAGMFYIRGGGDGHGIGMSQYGAYGYALHGKSYRFILAHYYQGTTIGTVDPTRTVRVLLGTGGAAFSGATRAAAKQLNPSLTYGVHPLANGSLSLVAPSGKQVGRFPAPLTVTGPGPLDVAGLGPYRGSLVFRPDGSGGVQTVNALGLDDYVRGVISAEMPAGWSSEALKAQAVAARTYAITTDVAGSTYDLYPDTRSQMYRGISAEQPSTDAAVAATRGQVVTYNGLPVVTYFFNSSGGHTENIENVWPGATPEPWLRGVPDPYDNAGGDPYHRWAYDLTLADASARLGRLVKGQLLGITITGRGASPRILTAEVVGTRGRTQVSGIQLQQIFGLYTTYAAFTTISASDGLPAGFPARAHRRIRRVAGAQAVLALVPLVHSILAGAAHGISGAIFPAPPGKGVSFTVQLLGSHGWRTAASAKTGAGGVFAVQLPAPGTYRIVFRGLDGPAVGVL